MTFTLFWILLYDRLYYSNDPQVIVDEIFNALSSPEGRLWQAIGGYTTTSVASEIAYRDFVTLEQFHASVDPDERYSHVAL